MTNGLLLLVRQLVEPGKALLHHIFGINYSAEHPVGQCPQSRALRFDVHSPHHDRVQTDILAAWIVVCAVGDHAVLRND